ncbi:spore coat U domain-containing protein [Azoarcus sp. KH32C]|uniref:Csu type fimbrial protein n=1 Tax=Azoarcus sp. KH32C TaxID=748247 RepID=UPI00034AB94D|nr:spore coat U domain-containing protein [Azoarcus sp. KH32C]
MSAFRASEGCMKRRAVLAALACAAALAAPARAQAAQDFTDLGLEALMGVELPARSATAELLVSVTAVESCIVGARGLTFGSYDPLLLAATDGVSDISVTCTAGAHYELGLNAGMGAGATLAARRMSQEGQTLTYSIYRDAARSQVWGDQVGSNSVAGVGTGFPVIHQVYGRIPARQSVRSGRYVDVIVATVFY